MSDSFFHLGPDAALAAAEALGLAPTGHCTPLTCLENRVYDLRLEGGDHVVVKFYRPGRWSREAILEEHAFLADLRAAEIPVCVPLALAGGATLVESQGLWTAIWPRTGGRSPDELRDPEIERLGRLLARIHAVGATRDAPHRPRFDARSRVEEPLAVLEGGGFLPPSCAQRYAAAAREVAASFEAWSQGVAFQRIHGDCHFGNLLQRDDEWFFLDFDDFGIGPAVQDVWMLCPGRDREGRRQRALLVEAYRQLRDFDEGELRLVEPLRAMRFVWYAGWIARRFADPVFPDAFPHFGSEEYWDRETRDLEEQLERIASGSDASPEGEGAAAGGPDAEGELTNEDFFWDL